MQISGHHSHQPNQWIHILGCLCGLGMNYGFVFGQVTPTYSAREFYETTSMIGSSFSADATRILCSSDGDGVFNLYSQPVDGGEPDQLTFSTSNALIAVSYFPFDDRVLFTRDEGGNELNHLYVREIDGSERDLTPGDRLKAVFAGWSEELKSFFVATNERDEGYFDLYRMDAGTFERQSIFENTDGYSIPEVSRNGRWIVAAKINSSRDSDLFVVDRMQPDKPAVNITPDDVDVQNETAVIAPDSKSVYYFSNRDSDFERVWNYDFETGEHTLVIDKGWDLLFVHFSWDGRYRATGTNVDGRTVVEVWDTHEERVMDWPEFGEANVTNVTFSRSGNRAAFYIDGDRSPPDLCVIDLGSRQYRQLTRCLNPKVDPEHLVVSQVVRYPSFDGLSIPALLYRPHQASAEHRVPAIVWVHGGPGGQSRMGYSAEIQFLINHGYAVLAVNNRGSSGYGTTFHHLDDRRHGEDDLNDVVYGRRYLETLDWIDGSKVAIMGGSYGGYMVCAALTFRPQAFDVGINIFGVTNWLRTLKSIPPWWASFRDSLYDELGNPEHDEERLHRISPLFHASNIEKPLLVIQGANDPRVLPIESDELVAAVRGKGVPVEYVVFPDEGHGFRRRENRITAAESYLKFLDVHLKNLP